MLIDKKILIKVNKKNIKNLIEFGYKNIIIGNEIEIFTNQLSKGSHVLVKISCDICGTERDIMYKEYLRNLSQGGYYSCKGKCSSDKNKKTCLEKYGVDNPSKLDIIKNKKSATCLNNFGVKFSFQSEEVRGKIKITMLEKYGVDNPSKSLELQQKKIGTMVERHGVEYYVLSDDFKEKSEKTNIKNCGFSHSMMDINTVKERLSKKGLDFETDEFKIYRNKVDLFTRKNKKKLLEIWDGFDYYDKEYIKDNFNLSYSHGNYPTIDHIYCVSDGFKNNLPPEEISKIENLCFTKRWINSKKYTNNNFILWGSVLPSR